jgi:membrane-bound inhibitor of C-type lysozyme
MTIGKKVKSVTKITQQKTKVYDIEVADAHHYILGDGTVSHNSYVPTKKMGGGSGLEYAASTIVFLSKKKDKMLDDDDGRTGAVIVAHTKKARLTIEDKKVETWLNYSTGLDPYYGLLGLAEQFGIVKKVSTRYEFPTGEKAFESQIKKDPKKFFTQDILNQIDEGCKKEFLYGKSEVIVENDDD